MAGRGRGRGRDNFLDVDDPKDLKTFAVQWTHQHPLEDSFCKRNVHQWDALHRFGFLKNRWEEYSETTGPGIWV